MDVSFITEFISPIAMVVCLGVGFIIKNCTSSHKLHQYIPVIAGVLGVVICSWETFSFTPVIIATGLISGLASTGLYEAFRNILNLYSKEDGPTPGDM